jgi:hypothetical protein
MRVELQAKALLSSHSGHYSRLCFRVQNGIGLWPHPAWSNSRSVQSAAVHAIVMRAPIDN